MRPLPLLLLLAACASTPGTGGGSPGSGLTPTLGPTRQFAPTPYTAAQIRSCNPPGTRTVYRIATEGQPTVVQTTWFVTDDGERTHMEAETADEAGKLLGEIQRSAAAWSELRDHARFPAASVIEVTEASTTTPAGTFACKLYVLERDHDGRPAVHRFWFDEEAAGSPVLYEIEQDGRVTFRMELLEENRRRLTE